MEELAKIIKLIEKKNKSFKDLRSIIVGIRTHNLKLQLLNMDYSLLENIKTNCKMNVNFF